MSITTITPNTLRVKRAEMAKVNPMLVSVYKQVVRFSKGAATELRLPGRVRFDIHKDGTIDIVPDQEGFNVELANNEFVIRCRALCKVFLRDPDSPVLEFKTKVLYQLVSHKTNFQLKPINNVYEKVN